MNRPLTLIRCPAGAQKKCFVQRHSWAGMNPAIQRALVPEEVLTVRDIAGEKLAVVREGATLVLGDDQPEVNELAAATGARIDALRELHGMHEQLTG